MTMNRNIIAKVKRDSLQHSDILESHRSCNPLALLNCIRTLRSNSGIIPYIFADIFLILFSSVGVAGPDCFLPHTSYLPIHISFPLEKLVHYQSIKYLSVSRQANSLFQTEFSKECDLELPPSTSSIFLFPKGHPTAAYVSFLAFLSLESFLQ
jgi:hypothetical protein